MVPREQIERNIKKLMLTGVHLKYDGKDRAFIDLSRTIAENVVIPEGIQGLGLTGRKTINKSIKSLPGKDLRVIGQHTFGSCPSLENVNLPNLEALGDESFHGCMALTNLDLSNIKCLGNCALGYTGLETVKFSKKLRKVGRSVLRSAQVKKLDLSEVSSKVEFDCVAFSHCIELEEVIFKNKINIVEDMFYGCESITEVELPKGITELGANSFRE